MNARSLRSNNQEDDAPQPLAAFFADRRGAQRGRRPTSNLVPQLNQTVGGLYRPTTPVKPVIAKRKLQMESIGLYPSRPATTVHTTGPRAKNNNVIAQVPRLECWYTNDLSYDSWQPNWTPSPRTPAGCAARS